MKDASITRRSFVGIGCLGAMGVVAGLSGCAPEKSGAVSPSPAENAAATTNKASETLLPNSGNLEFSRPQGGKVAFEEEAIDETRIIETIECDVVVCGAGMSGVSAAVSASENGLKTVLLEKGSTFAARGTEIAAIGDHVHAEAGIELDPEEFLGDALSAAHFRCDREVWLQWIKRSGEALDWGHEQVGDACGQFFCKGGNTHFAGVTTWGTGVRLEKGIASFVEAMVNKAIANGTDVRYDTPAVQLVRENEKVTGVVAKSGEGYVRFIASKGVVLATGGYEFNWDLLTQRIRPRDLAVYAWINPTTTDTGDGLLMGLAAGAAEDDWPHILMNDPAGAKTGSRANGAMLAFLRVNENGKRFVNENLSFEYMSNAIMYQPGAHDFVLIAGDILPALEKAKGGAPWTPEDMYESIKNVLVEASTLEELAERCGIDYKNLAATVERYNELCALGEDTDFGKNPNDLIPLEEGPYYAVEESGCCLVSVNGLRTDARSRVLDPSDKTIEGLYALGNVSGSMFNGTYPHHISAISHGRCLTFGYLTGRQLAGLE